MGSLQRSLPGIVKTKSSRPVTESSTTSRPTEKSWYWRLARWMNKISELKSEWYKKGRKVTGRWFLGTRKGETQVCQSSVHYDSWFFAGWSGGGARAYLCWHRAGGGEHPGQAASSSRSSVVYTLVFFGFTIIPEAAFGWGDNGWFLLCVCILLYFASLRIMRQGKRTKKY